MICTNSLCSSDTASFRGNVSSLIINLRNNDNKPYGSRINHLLIIHPVHANANARKSQIFPYLSQNLLLCPMDASYHELSHHLLYLAPLLFLQEPQSCKRNIFGQGYLEACGIKGCRTHGARDVPLVMHGIHS